MGTWDDGLLDNDCALDGLGELGDGVVNDIERVAAGRSSAVVAARLAAMVGVLLQLAPEAFDADMPDAARISAALRAHARAIEKLPPTARRILVRVMEGAAGELAERPARLAKTHAALLHAEGGEAFGRRVPALFIGTAGAAYVQTVARRCVAMIDEDFEDESNWSDLCREGIGMGGLAALLVLAPCSVSARKLAGWRRKARTGLAQLEAEADDELEFHRGYYARLDRVFAVLLRRFAA